MDISRLEQEQLIERYILNQMDDEEASEFEAFFLSNQECIDQLEMAEKLYQGLGLIANSTGITEKPPSKSSKDSNNHSWWRQKVPVWSFAAILMVSILPSGFLYQQLQKQNMPQGHISVINIPMSEHRNHNKQVIKIAEADKPVILSFYIDTDMEPGYSSYGFELKQQNSDVLALQFLNLPLGNDDMLYIDLGKNYLPEGVYDFSILSISDNNRKTSLKTGQLAIKK